MNKAEGPTWGRFLSRGSCRHDRSSRTKPMGLRRRRPRFDASAFDSVVDGVKTIYRDKIRPLEEQYMMPAFGTPLLTDEYFDAKPMVLMVGSYSTGKTSFIKYLLEQDYPGIHVGPEPTTDRFQAIMYGPQERELPGHTLLANPASPFTGLSQFGNAFVSRFGGCELPSEFAKGCTLVDTPGILSGKKQTHERQYSYESVIQWFAPRCDMILLMFDANKIDISDELKRVSEPHESHPAHPRLHTRTRTCARPCASLCPHTSPSPTPGD